MNRELSSYLDFLRFTAALAVLLGHAQADGLYMSWLPLYHFSHEAVVVFFVMSGFIIYWTTLKSGRGAMDYAIARASRVYSVALPAVVFSIGCSILLFNDLKIGENYPSGFVPPSLLDLLSSLFFLNESWLNSAELSLNNPFWSLCYEFWYYVIFGLWLFFPRAHRWKAVLLVMIVAGPAVVLLFPIWIAGAWLAENFDRIRFSLSCWQATFLFAGSFAVIFFINFFEIDVFLREKFQETIPGYWRLDKSQRFLTDYLIGISLIFNIVVFQYLPSGFRSFFGRFKDVFTYLAGFSFTLYLFHRPLTQMLGFYYPNNKNSVVYSLLALVGLLLTCLLISYATERQLSRWRQLLRKLVLRPAN